jgi:aminoglycoside phosphotransferase (APT) family kinase protein
MADQSRQETFSGTKDVAETHRFDEKRLFDYLSEHIDGFDGPMDVRQFKGGQSNPTYQLITPGRKYVLRRKPPGKLLKSAHAVDREYRIIKALNNTDFPVPKAYILCEDEEIIGTVFYVMECVEGRVIWDLLIPGVTNDHRAAIYDAMNETLAKLHTTNYSALGLDDFGKPGNYFARQIGRWSKQYTLSESQEIAEMNRLIEWLPENIPANEEVSIVHGDYRLDNMVIHPTEPRVIAVLDWELCTLGHPLADFSYHIAQWRMPKAMFMGMIGHDIEALGIPSEAEYTRAYCERTGRDEIEHMDFYMAYNIFRLACILQGIVGRVRDGTASSAHAEQNALIVKPLAELAMSFARRVDA